MPCLALQERLHIRMSSGRFIEGDGEGRGRGRGQLQRNGDGDGKGKGNEGAIPALRYEDSYL